MDNEKRFNFAPVYPASPDLVYICYRCGNQTKNAVADLLGPAFKAYYCPDCVSEMTKDEED